MQFKTLGKPELKLLAIVEVDKDERVYCQSPACTRTVYRQIHVVELKGEILVLGSRCYSVLCGAEQASDSHYTGTLSRRLTSEERELLLDNTKALIVKFEGERVLDELKTQQETNQKKQVTAGFRVEAQQENEDDALNIRKLAEDDSPTHCLASPDRTVSCSYCSKPMSTNLLEEPARGFKCKDCKATGWSDYALRQTHKNPDAFD